MQTKYIKRYDGWIVENVSEGFCRQFREDAELPEAETYREWLADGNEPDYFPSIEEAIAMIEEAN
ncbi:hypothetical protein UFOVP1226_14 [uncultured Caudovirales phage]|uniref:Uncharacterized protein n=1 Tax=uncultured Caudovirales phage TaxID=2100421 RepID=A0A6J5LPN9_9CAUD|nr:hypothetical protein UFOVP278_28 [uncultured Caudovirales phage]CAB4191067.1 hypothetical protein UFOVP1226_14 [uncultured Caudovirales phage]